ncbi:MAG TPA: hypothetical protein VMS21_01840 [Methylomirabilota bacterium]|nr:hypothetical protein [Methylomirabilota bacterium]
MPEETEQPIDPLLKAYGRKRRKDAGEPLELHPATRRMLQGEVTRAFGGASGKASPSSRWRGLAGLWPRLLFGGGAVAAVAAVLIVWRPADDDFQAPETVGSLAANRMEEREGVGVMRDEAFRRGSSNQDSQADHISESMMTREEPAMKLETAPQPLLAPRMDVAPSRSVRTETSPPTSPPPVRSGESLSLARGATTSAESATLEPAAEPIPQPAKVGRADTSGEGSASATVRRFANTTDLGAAVRDRYGLVASDSEDQATGREAAGLLEGQIFQRVTADGVVAERTGSSEVLSQFRLVRATNEVRIVDADGSVYQGPVLAEGTVQLGRPFEGRPLEVDSRESVPAQTSVAGDSSPGFSFFASGTNRSLNQVVSFRGTFSPEAARSAGQTSATAPPTSRRSRDQYRLQLDAPGTRDAADSITGASVSRAQSGATVGLGLQSVEASGDEGPLPPGLIEGVIEVGDSLQFRIQAVQAPESP